MALSDQKLTEDEPAYRKLHRICLAACMMLAPLIVLLGFAFDPTGGVPPAPAEIFAAYQAASPLKIQLFLFFNAITPYVSCANLPRARSRIVARSGTNPMYQKIRETVK